MAVGAAGQPIAKDAVYTFSDTGTNTAALIDFWQRAVAMPLQQYHRHHQGTQGGADTDATLTEFCTALYSWAGGKA
jgi:hypothetical protein